MVVTFTLIDNYTMMCSVLWFICSSGAVIEVTNWFCDEGVGGGVCGGRVLPIKGATYYALGK